MTFDEDAFSRAVAWATIAVVATALIHSVKELYEIYTTWRVNSSHDREAEGAEKRQGQVLYRDDTLTVKSGAAEGTFVFVGKSGTEYGPFSWSDLHSHVADKQGKRLACRKGGLLCDPTVEGVTCSRGAHSCP